ncbi:MAG: fasciclin domain-containing protein [Stigonema ocellatum SAG 48.90 = DSM 106950]|nr:fasciclin domain-containing protein [Stigonema ocellatum SAG 48.90 = DSM 106950]
MKLNNSNLLTKLVRIVGVTGVGLLIAFPSGANEYKKPLLVVQQNSGGKVLNPRPSIFNEPPYNRSRTSPGEATPPTGTPTTPETTPPTGTPNTPPLPSQKPSSSTGSKDLIALAQSNSQFTTLSRALKAAGLTETLKGKGPFTVFAPTNAAFAELPQDAVAELFKPENKEVLVKILTYHVVSGQVLSTDLKSGEVKSIEGSPISVKVDGKNGVMVNDAKVTQADLKASNGVIHVINKVILPPNL